MTETFKRWAIRQKSTGFYLPQSSRKRHGYTHDEPVTLESNLCPRLFARQQDAKTALTWWLKGETTVGWTTDDEDWHTQPKAERNAEDFEVVNLKFAVIEPRNILRETS